MNKAKKERKYKLGQDNRISEELSISNENSFL